MDRRAATGCRRLQRAENAQVIGQRFGLVTVLKRDPVSSSLLGSIRYLVKCECGTVYWLRGNNLKREPPKTHLRCKREKENIK